MIHIDRLPKPEILEKKELEWTQQFIESGKSRPDASKYGHESIRSSLNSMSFHKCYYCERKLSNTEGQIDHFIEVSDTIGKELAYQWENLYLACPNCNKKKIQ